jgi:hypothetical protein
MDGLSSLKSIGDDLLLRQNQTLLNLVGLDSLQSIGGSLSIYDHPTLASLIALNNLHGVGQYLEILGNTSLTTLSGLDNINANSIDFLAIYDNPSLSNCHVQSVCDYLASHNFGYNIQNNASGCNNDYQIEAACSTIGINDEDINFNFFVYPNPTKDIITLDNDLRGNITIFDIHGNLYFSADKPSSILVIDVSKFVEGMYFLRLINEHGVHFAKLVKE